MVKSMHSQHELCHANVMPCHVRTSALQSLHAKGGAAGEGRVGLFVCAAWAARTNALSTAASEWLHDQVHSILKPTSSMTIDSV